MQPRLKSSKKWTAFPEEYSKQIETVFKENFAEPLSHGKLVVEGRIYPAEIVLRVGISHPGQLKQPNFEVSVDYSQSKKDAMERIHNCVDAVASMMAEYFEDEEKVDFPKTWQEFPFQGHTLYLQFTTENSDLEAQANALLGAAGEAALVHGEDSDEEIDLDAELKKATTAADPAEDDDEDLDDEDKSPRMFGGKPKKKTKKSGLH